MSSSSEDSVGPADGQPADDEPTSAAPVREADSTKNWMGFAAYATGALGLSVIAVVLGHLGLSAVAKGQATNRAFALAGLILGYIGLAATTIALAFFLLIAAPNHARDSADAYAQADTAAVGSAIARHWIENGTAPTVTQSGDGYVVEDNTIDAMLDNYRTVTYYGSQPTQWCFMIEFEGGSEPAFSYVPTEGLVTGAVCDAPPSDEPEPAASPSPDASATPTPGASPPTPGEDSTD